MVDEARYTVTVMRSAHATKFVTRVKNTQLSDIGVYNVTLVTYGMVVRTGGFLTFMNNLREVIP